MQNAVEELEDIATEMEQVLSRFSHSREGVHIAQGDQAIFTGLAMDAIDIMQEAFKGGVDMFPSSLQGEVNRGTLNWIGRQSYSSVEQSIAIVKSAAKALRRRASPDPAMHEDASTERPNITDVVSSLNQLRDILISVSTGGARIQVANTEYHQRFESLDANLRQLGLANPIPYRDLWQWYGRWSGGDFPTYQSRRVHIAELIDPLIAALRSERHDSPSLPTGWAAVDRAIGKARIDLAAAKNVEDFQAIGHLCREILISLAQAVFDPHRHRVDDVESVSSTDFKRRIEAYIAAEIGGGSAEDQRRHARAAFDLANNLQHKRTATFRNAAICLEATSSIVNIIAIVSGRRDPG